VLKRIPRKIRNLRRSRQIANVLIKQGFGAIIQRIELRLPLTRKPGKGVENIPAPVRARLALEELGPTFIKFGQILSMRPELIPVEYIEELKKLQDNVPPFSYEEAADMIKKDLGSPVNELFESFDKEPVAAASISQVHRAILNGEDVVVKVQRPKIESDIEADLDILFNLARLISNHIPESNLYDPVGIVSEFSKSIKKELDFMVEARNADKFKRNFAGYAGVYVPPIYWEATGKRVLTMEMIRGEKVESSIKDLDAVERKALADKIAKSYMKQIFVDGFFHGDPHPGNIVIVDREVIAYMDFGIMGRVDEYMKDRLSSLFIAIIQKNRERIVDELLDIGITGEETSIPDFRNDIGEIIDEYYGTELKQVDIPTMMNDVLKTAIKHRIKIPANFTLLIKTLANMEGLCQSLSSEFNYTETAKPFVESMVAERVAPKRLIAKFMENISEINDSVTVLPRKVNQVLNKLQQGKLVIDLEHKGLNKVISELDTMTNRTATSLIVSAIIVGSSVIMLTGKGPLLFDFPVVGILGYLAAGFIGFFLVLSILRSGKY
jgi:ubiquinone biosynthesis protein